MNWISLKKLFIIKPFFYKKNSMPFFSFYQKLCRFIRRPKKAWIGQYGEFLTYLYLWGSGYRIIRRNDQSNLGEIDLLATKNRHLYVIEVKYRGSLAKANWPHHPLQRQRQLRQLQVFLIKHPRYQNYPVYLVLAIIQPLQIPKLVIYS